MVEIYPERDYFAFLAEGRFMLLRSRSSGRYFFYPRVAEPATGARDLEWVQASGRGTVYATTVVRPKPPEAPYNVVLVDLDEGPRVMSRVEGIDPESVSIGMAVKAYVHQQDDQGILLFQQAACAETRGAA